MGVIVAILFDTDRYDNSAVRRVFNVTPTTPCRLTAAGLALDECVPLYVRVADVAPGQPCETWTWAPLMKCGRPVHLCGYDNQISVLVPGTYIIGTPITVPVFAGPVVIEASSLAGMDPAILAGLDECPCCVAGDVIGVQTDWTALRS